MRVKTVGKEENRFLYNPLTVKQMATQINKASDAYISLKPTEKELQEILYYYAKHHYLDSMGSDPSTSVALSSREEKTGFPLNNLTDNAVCDKLVINFWSLISATIGQLTPSVSGQFELAVTILYFRPFIFIESALNSYQ